MDYLDILRERARNLVWADSLIVGAISGNRKLTLGEKLFITTSAKNGFNIPYPDRTREMDRILYNFLSIGVLNVRELRREDGIVDLFYSDGGIVNSDRFARM